VAAANELVLRVLPCRSEAQDRENFQATRRVSGHHGEFAVGEDGALRLVDRSSMGTTIDGVRLPRDTPARLPRLCRIGVAGVIELEAETLGEESAPDALVLGRLGNQESHVYVWVVRRFSIEGRGEVVNEGGVLRYAGAPGVRGAAFRADDLCVAD
jgi:hypothetical protein